MRDPRVDALQSAVMRIAGICGFRAPRPLPPSQKLRTRYGRSRGMAGVRPAGPGSDPDPDPALHDRGVVLLRRAWTGADRPGMKRVLLLATTTGYQIRSFGEAAERLGVRLVFASDRCDQLDDPWSDQRDSGSLLGRGRIGRRRARRVRATTRPTASSRSAIGRRFSPRASREALGLPGQSARRGPRQPQQAREPRVRSRAAGLLTPSFFDVSIADDPSALAARLHLSRRSSSRSPCREAAA